MSKFGKLIIFILFLLEIKKLQQKILESHLIIRIKNEIYVVIFNHIYLSK